MEHLEIFNLLLSIAKIKKTVLITTDEKDN